MLIRLYSAEQKYYEGYQYNLKAAHILCWLFGVGKTAAFENLP